MPLTSTVFVFSRLQRGGAWSRYRFPFAITEFQLFGDALYMRHGDAISTFDKTLVSDELENGDEVEFAGRVRWNYLDCGEPGATKYMQGFEFVGTGQPSFSVGYDQRNFNLTTTPYAIDADTLPGGMIPLDVWGPSFSFIVDFAPGAAWSLSMVQIYVDQMGNGP